MPPFLSANTPFHFLYHTHSVLALYALFCLCHIISCPFSIWVFSCGDDFDNKERLIPLIDETRETTHNRGGMDRVESESEIWPIEHPIEPLDEDRPVKCPMPHSSVINDGRMHKERSSESLRKRAELSAAVYKEGTVAVAAAAEPPLRAMRKRHHTLTRGDHTITPLLRMPPLYPYPPQNITIFDMLQKFNKFES